MVRRKPVVSIVVVVVVACTLAVAAPARAEEARREKPPVGVEAAAKLGVILPQLFTPLGANLAVGVEIGYQLPFAGRRFRVLLTVDYSQPPADGKARSDAVGGEYTWTLSQRELAIGLVGGARFPQGGALTPWIALGPRLYLLETRANGASAGEPFGEYVETSTELGAVVAGGVDYRVGPGALVGELEVGFSDLDHLTTGEASTGAFGVRAGYRLTF